MEDKKSFLAGFFSGVSHVVSGHPLDTIKVYSQQGLYKKNMYKISNLYRGISYPLITNSSLISLQFGIYDNLRKNNYSITTSAAGAGLCLGILSTPIDLFKIRKQTFSNNIYKKPFVGILPTLYREIPANIIYFNTYYKLKKEVSIPVAGGITGVLSWLLTYPTDVIKTRIQSGTCNTMKEAYLKGNLFRGITPCLTRALLVNAVGFYTYEKIMSLK